MLEKSLIGHKLQYIILIISHQFEFSICSSETKKYRFPPNEPFSKPYLTLGHFIRSELLLVCAYWCNIGLNVTLSYQPIANFGDCNVHIGFDLFQNVTVGCRRHTNCMILIIISILAESKETITHKNVTLRHLQRASLPHQPWLRPRASHPQSHSQLTPLRS